MTFDVLDLALKSASFFLSVAAILYSFLINRRKDVDERFHAGSKRMDALEIRIQTSEQTLGTMPGKDDMHRLELTLSEIGGDMKAMRATMKGMAESLTRTENIVGRHEDHLRENHR